MKNKIIEFVIFRVKENPENNKTVLLNEATKGLAKCTGFLSRRVYQSIDEPNLLIDYVEWDTLEHAEEAAKQMKSIPELAAFVKLIDTTILFDHFKFYDEHILEQKETDTTEFIVYELKPENNAQINHFFTTYTNELAKARGYLQRTLLQSLKKNNLWFERANWSSINDAQVNEKAMQQNANLGALFTLIEKVQLMKLFKELK